MSLNALQENASRLGMRLQESFSEHTRDLAIGKPSGAAFFDTAEDKVKNIRRQLDSSQDREKLEGMKRLIAMISKGRNVSEFFAQVVKNVASPNLEIRKLVYIYLLRYAEHEQDLALLSINTFQKDLTDSNPLIRAMALRVLSGIKVPMVGSIVALGVKKCAADPSPYVRKAAALAIPKLYSLDPSHLTSLEPILLSLLRDRSPVSVGCVAVAFNAVCPHRLDLLHGHYRRLCRILVDADEWGQASLMDLLLRYARHMLTKPPDPEETNNNKDDIDPDIQLLLSNSEPLFQSRNPAVVMAACRTHYSLVGTHQLPMIIPPLLRLTHSAPSPEVERVILSYLVFIARESPSHFAQQYNRFFIRSRDLPQTKRAKVKILLSLINPDNVQEMIREFTDYSTDTDDQLVADSIHAIGRCARAVPDSNQQCLTALMNFIQSDYDIVVSNAVLVLKSLVQSQLSSRPQLMSDQPSSSKAPLQIISRLAYKFDAVRHPSARACILWIVGQYAARTESSASTSVASIEGMADWAPDTLRKVAKNFSQEASIAKLQAVMLAAKLLVLNPIHHVLCLLARYVFSLARYDLDYDVRDRARTMGSLLTGVVPALRPGAVEDGDFVDEQGSVVLRREQVKRVLFEGKAETPDTDTFIAEQEFLGSLSILLGKDLPGDRHLPDWLEEGTDSSLRDTEDDNVLAQVYPQRAIQNIAVPSRVATPVVLTPGGAPSPVGSFTQRAKWTDLDLDKFYDDDENDSDDSEESNEEESDEEIQDAPSQEVTTPQSDDGDEEEEEEEEEEGGEESSEKATEEEFQGENGLPA